MFLNKETQWSTIATIWRLQHSEVFINKMICDYSVYWSLRWYKAQPIQWLRDNVRCLTKYSECVPIHSITYFQLSSAIPAHPPGWSFCSQAIPLLWLRGLRRLSCCSPSWLSWPRLNQGSSSLSCRGCCGGFCRCRCLRCCCCNYRD